MRLRDDVSRTDGSSEDSLVSAESIVRRIGDEADGNQKFGPESSWVWVSIRSVWTEIPVPGLSPMALMKVEVEGGARGSKFQRSPEYTVFPEF